jgi:hypothetical protein
MATGHHKDFFMKIWNLAITLEIAGIDAQAFRF